MTEYYYARFKDSGELVSAVHANKGVEYMCLCPDQHSVYLKRPSGKHGVRIITPHFSHFPVRHGCEEYVRHSSCRTGGESEEHMAAKFKLRDRQGEYSFALKVCTGCGKEEIEDCKNGTIQLEVASYDKKWRYDVYYQGYDGKCIALEVKHKHATSIEKIQATKDASILIAEFKSAEINQLEKGSHLENLLVEKITCDECKERNELLRQERLQRQTQEKEERLESERAEMERKLEHEKEAKEQQLERDKAWKIQEETFHDSEQKRKGAYHQNMACMNYDERKRKAQEDIKLLDARRKKVPRDTYGFPLPPPCPSFNGYPSWPGTLPPSKWEDYWFKVLGI